MKERSQYKIFIDTSDRNNTEVSFSVMVDSEFKEIFRKEGSLDVTSTIKNFMEENGISFSEISLIDSNPGPGSFTGLRISSTISNVLNWILGKKNINELKYPNYGREPNITPPKKFKL